MKLLLSIFALLILGYLSLLLAIYFLQSKLLYHPLLEQLSDIELSNLKLKRVMVDGEVAAYTNASTVSYDKAVILFHGNAGSAYHRSYYLETFEKLGYRTYLAEYPGYGERPGVPGEAALTGSAYALIEALSSQPQGKIILWGESLGAGVVANLTAHSELGVDSIILVTPWDSLASVARFHYPFVPVGWILKEKYNSAENLAAYQGKVSIVVAENDQTIPRKFGKRLYDSISGDNKKLFTVAAAGHNDWVNQVDRKWFKTLLED